MTQLKDNDVCCFFQGMVSESSRQAKVLRVWVERGMVCWILGKVAKAQRQDGNPEFISGMGGHREWERGSPGCTGACTCSVVKLLKRSISANSWGNQDCQGN